MQNGEVMVALGEIDAARLQHPTARVRLLVHEVAGVHPSIQAAAVTNSRGQLVVRLLPTRWTTSTRPGFHGTLGMVDEGRRG